MSSVGRRAAKWRRRNCESTRNEELDGSLENTLKLIIDGEVIRVRAVKVQHMEVA